MYNAVKSLYVFANSSSLTNGYKNRITWPLFHHNDYNMSAFKIKNHIVQARASKQIIVLVRYRCVIMCRYVYVATFFFSKATDLDLETEKSVVPTNSFRFSIQFSMFHVNWFLPNYIIWIISHSYILLNTFNWKRTFNFNTVYIE